MASVKPFDLGNQNYVIDYIMPTLSGNEFKTLTVILRKTNGFGKASDEISYSQLQTLTGISSFATLKKCLDRLEELTYIFTTSGDRLTANTYTINRAFEVALPDRPITENEIGGITEIVTPITENVIGEAEKEVGGITEIVNTIKESLKESSSVDINLVSKDSLFGEKTFSPPAGLDDIQKLKPHTDMVNGGKVYVKVSDEWRLAVLVKKTPKTIQVSYFDSKDEKPKTILADKFIEVVYQNGDLWRVCLGDNDLEKLPHDVSALKAKLLEITLDETGIRLLEPKDHKRYKEWAIRAAKSEVTPQDLDGYAVWFQTNHEFGQAGSKPQLGIISKTWADYKSGNSNQSWKGNQNGKPSNYLQRSSVREIINEPTVQSF